MSNNAEIAIVMASDYDLPVMRHAAHVLDRFGVPYEMDILSTHQNPERMIEFARNAHPRGLKVVIAGAGGAAHLPGMIAAFTPLPVIGVPVKVEYSIDGLDAIYSMLQMPQGVPVATMALNNAENAALFALQVLGSSHSSYLELVHAYKKQKRDAAEDKAAKLAQMGYEQYLVEHPYEDHPND